MTTVREALWQAFFETLQKQATIVRGFTGDPSGFGGDPRGEMHRFVQAAPAPMAFRSSGSFQGFSPEAFGAGSFGGGGGGEGGFVASVPGGLVHNYRPSAEMLAALQRVRG